jgi:hypothetical protein
MVPLAIRVWYGSDTEPLPSAQDKDTPGSAANREEDESGLRLTASQLALLDRSNQGSMSMNGFPDTENALYASIEKTAPQSSLRRRVSRSLGSNRKQSSIRLQKLQAPSFHGD